jgi:hypothetical protein
VFSFSFKDIAMLDKLALRAIPPPVVPTGDPAACEVNLVSHAGGGDTFDGYVTDSTGGFTYGTGFSGGWVLTANAVGLLSNDDFESYAEGSDVSNLNAGTGFTGIWAVLANA